MLGCSINAINAQFINICFRLAPGRQLGNVGAGRGAIVHVFDVSRAVQLWEP